MDKAFSAFLVLLGAFIVVSALNYGLFKDGVPGAGLFPIIAGTAIMGLSVVNLLRQMRSKEVVEGRVGRGEILPILGISLLLAVFVALSPWLGVLLQLPFVLIVMSYLVEPRRGLLWFLQIVGLSVAVCVFSYFLFEKWLGVLFPPGPFGF
jgi:hypothetical protein